MILKIIKTLYRAKKFKRIGPYSILERGEYYHTSNLEIGSSVYIGPGCQISANGGLKIKDGTILGPKVTIYTSNHNYSVDLKSVPYDNMTINKEVIIDKYVWIGGNVVILPGTYIGEGAIIGAGEVVRGCVPPYSILINGDYRKKRKDINHFQMLVKNNKIYMYEKMRDYEYLYKIGKKFLGNLK